MEREAGFFQERRTNAAANFGVGTGKGAAETQGSSGAKREARTKRDGDPWQTECHSACCSSPFGCLKMMFCAPCLTFTHRKKILGNQWPSGYKCCGGTCNMW